MSGIICFILAFIAGLTTATIFSEKLKLQRNILRHEVEQLRLQLEAYKPKKPTLGEKLEELLPNIDGDTLGAVLNDILPLGPDIDNLDLEDISRICSDVDNLNLEDDDILPIPPRCSDRAENDVSDNWEDNPGW